jgi:hypothetical protein
MLHRVFVAQADCVCVAASLGSHSSFRLSSRAARASASAAASKTRTGSDICEIQGKAALFLEQCEKS